MKIETSDKSMKTEDSKFFDLGNEEKKKKRKKKATICTTYCKFDIVRRISKNLGMKDVPYNESWNVLWTDYSVSVAKIKVLKGYQRVNHFPGMVEICHKALLAKNLNRMAKSFPKAYAFFPKTWCFPTEYKDAVDYSKKHIGRTYILKPGAGCRGQGIQLTKNFRTLPPADKLICQLYISKPFLVDGLKFDLRIYTLVTSCNPLRIFVYNEGLARFATAPYRKPAGYNLSNCYMHLTNYSVNKYSSTFVSDGECGTKRRLSCLNQWLSRNLYDIEDIWAKIDDVIIKTIISALPVIKHSYHVSFPNHNVIPACFEILGFDILLDNNLNPFVLEVNHSPSFNCDSKVDEEIKLALLEDTFRLLNLADTDTAKVLDNEKRLAKKRLTSSNSELNDSDDYNDKTWVWKEGDKGNYRLVYPVKGKPPGTKDDPYRIFIETSCCINLAISETVASTIRGSVSKIQRDHMTEKDQLRQLLKVHNNNKQNQMYKYPEITLKNKVEYSKTKFVKSEGEKNSTMEPNNNKNNNDKDTKDVEQNNPDDNTYQIQKKSKQDNEESSLQIQLFNNNKENINKMAIVKEANDVKVETQIKEECQSADRCEDKEHSISNKENIKFNKVHSSINLVILDDEQQNNMELKNQQESQFFVKKLYRRLKESGHMPGAPMDTPEKKVIELQEIDKINQKTIEKNKNSSNCKHNKRNKILNVADLREISEAAAHLGDCIDTKQNQVTEFTLRFHSKAASEFLKFQKLKLLKRFKDLT